MRGPSPRVRGKQNSAISPTWSAGSIPACAGETPGSAGAGRRSGVHPRVCGGNSSGRSRQSPRRGPCPRVRGKPIRFSSRSRFRGSIPACAGETPGTRSPPDPARVHPRVCGGNVPMTYPALSDGGPSPRVRGKLSEVDDGGTHTGSIPACAGETLDPLEQQRVIEVHPRVCGGNQPRNGIEKSGSGPSPRVRGKRIRHNR